MKTAVVYYSLSGNTKWIAEQIAKALNADLIELKTQRRYPGARWLQMVICGASVTFKRMPRLANLPSLSSYDNIILGAPVWAGTVASPMNTFLHKAELSGKNVALFAMSGGGDVAKFMSRMEEALPKSNVVGKSDFRSVLQKETQEQTKQAVEWAKSLPF